MVTSEKSGAADEPWRSQLGALGAFIRTQRTLADLSLREMAAMTKVSNAYLSQVERGLHQPSLKVLRSIADALGLSTDQLLAATGWLDHGGEATTPTADGTQRRGRARTAGPAPAAGGTEAAILADPDLTEAQRQALLGVYRSFRPPAS